MQEKMESRMTSRFCPEQLKGWNFHLQSCIGLERRIGWEWKGMEILSSFADILVVFRYKVAGYTTHGRIPASRYQF
jgi:hypothetical protein